MKSKGSALSIIGVVFVLVITVLMFDFIETLLSGSGAAAGIAMLAVAAFLATILWGCLVVTPVIRWAGVWFFSIVFSEFVALFVYCQPEMIAEGINRDVLYTFMTHPYFFYGLAGGVLIGWAVYSLLRFFPQPWVNKRKEH